MKANQSPPEGPARGLFGPTYTPPEADYLRRHVVKMADGRFENSGEFWTSAADVEKLFQTHLPAALKEAKAAKRPLRVLFWAHGGLVSEKDSLRYVIDYGKLWESAGIYPVYFVWKTGVLDSLSSLMGGGGQRGWFTDMVSDPLLELTLRGAATTVWSAIKNIAAAACAPSGGATVAAELLRKFYDANRADVQCYAAGHSAGSIFHAHWLPKLAAANIPVQELFLLAPAATVELFAEKLQRLIGGKQSIRHCSMFTMTEDAERHDTVISTYRKSLLYFVSRACEAHPEQPVLGLAECLRTSPAMRTCWGLDANAAASGEIVYSPNRAYAGARASNSTSHGDFDNDPDTLNSLARRITGNAAVGPFNEKNTPRSLFAAAGAGEATAEFANPDLRPLKVAIGLRHGGIENFVAVAGPSSPLIHYRAVGHYEGAEPMGAERVLDNWVSGLPIYNRDQEGVVTGMTRRGTMSGLLGQTTVLPRKSAKSSETAGSAVFLGLGRSGGLGPAELTMAVREMCLQLSQMGGGHLATVLIGGGVGNMGIETAARAWLRGIRQAQDAPDFSITHITFIESIPKRYLKLERALGRALGAKNLLVLGPGEYQAVAGKAESDAVAEASNEIKLLRAEHDRRLAGEDLEATTNDPQRPEVRRITVRAEGDRCYFTAMTETASVPERVIQISPQIIDEISRAIAAATDPMDLREWGRTLQQLLIPSDLNGQLFSSAAPLVMALDATMARVPWELLTIPNRGTEPPMAEQLLGLATGYGVTRQLQTTFANLPERNRSSTVGLSVIVIADPAPDASLPGAYREAKWVEEFFLAQFPKDRFPKSRVVCLEGPDATRAKLAKELCNHAYDVLHFAGHCYFDKEHPEKSGWIFRRKPLEVFSADELLRLDRVPQFVFSNACESGVTPDRANEANPGVGPAFAEAFFAKGVSNFVCTGWPVDDRAALAFAKLFYQELFINHAPFQQAMLLARQEVATIGWQTVGAYQHYGNPFHTFHAKPAEDADGAPEPQPVTKPKATTKPKSTRK